MLIEHHREKLLNLIGFFYKNTNACGKTKLFKLLFYADFRHFQETGRPITNLQYFVWPNGPVPVELYEEMDHPKEDFQASFTITKLHDDKINTIPKKSFRFNPKWFSDKELKIVDEVALIFKHSTAKQMTMASHFPDDPWDRAKSQFGMQKLIPYDFAFTSHPSSLPLEEYRERLADERFIREMLE